MGDVRSKRLATFTTKELKMAIYMYVHSSRCSLVVESLGWVVDLDILCSNPY